ncbi:hypothetical protein G7Y79_00010g028420 [Physcia stellaris]|nr:hypothetical protein G7Y79_00010g028420 [Physcia stellaris]
MPKNAVGLFNTCYYFAFARTLWRYCFALRFNPRLLAKFAPLGVPNAAEAANKMDDLAGRHAQVTGIESELVMDAVRKSESVGLATWGQPAAPPTNSPAVPRSSLSEAPVTTSAYNAEFLKEIIPSEASSSEVLAATSACHKEPMKEIIPSQATLPEPEAPVATSTYGPELSKEIILSGAPPFEVLATTSTCHKELMKEIISSGAKLPQPEALVTTKSAYKPELLKEIILRGGSPSQVPPATTACHKELMKEIVSRQARIPEMDYYEQVMHYLTTKRPDSSIAKLNARASRAILGYILILFSLPVSLPFLSSSSPLSPPLSSPPFSSAIPSPTPSLTPQFPHDSPKPKIILDTSKHPTSHLKPVILAKDEDYSTLSRRFRRS